MTSTLPSIHRAHQPTPAEPAPAHPPVRERLLSLDVFRGMTVAGMLPSSPWAQALFTRAAARSAPSFPANTSASLAGAYPRRNEAADSR